MPDPLANGELVNRVYASLIRLQDRFNRQIEGNTMKSQELADAVGKIVALAQDRITGIGAVQYADGDQQKFERMTIDELFVYQEEELLDQINYSVMNLLRLWRVKAAAEAVHERMICDLEVSGDQARAVMEALFGEPKKQAVTPPARPEPDAADIERWAEGTA